MATASVVSILFCVRSAVAEIHQTHLSSVGKIQRMLQSDAGHSLQSHFICLTLQHAQAEHRLKTENTSQRLDGVTAENVLKRLKT